MTKSLHTKQEKPQILTYFPTKAYGHDGDIVISKIQGRGIFFCVKVNNIWYAQTTMQPLNKIDEIFIKNLKSEKITLNKIKNSEINSDKFLVSSNNNIRYRTGNQIIDDLGLSLLDIDYKTAYCSLQQYSDKETCEANGGTWYYSENDSHDNISSTAENQLLTVSQSIGNVDAEPTLLYDGSTLHIKYNSDYDDNWQTSAQTNLLKLSYDSTDSLQIAVAANGASTISTVDADGGNANLTMNIDGNMALNPLGSVIITSAGRTDFFVTGNTDDYARIAIGSNGEMTITTTDAAGSAADLTLAADGATKIQIFDGSEADSFHINIAGATNQMASFHGAADDQSIFKMYEMGGASTADYLEINVAEHGATTIYTVDGAATAADLTLDIDGDIELNADGGNINFKDASTTMASLSTASFSSEVPLKIKESADAVADSTGYGQIWVDSQNPCELAFTDEIGQDIIGIGKYHYETKSIGYYASQLGSYINFTARYVFEQTSTTGKAETLSFVVPYNGTIEKVCFRSEIAQDGDISFRVLEATDNTEIPTTTAFRKETTVDIADDTYQELDMTSPSTGSDYAPLTKGRAYIFYIQTPSNSQDTNITMVFKWDITS